ncbi:hypothetical protein C8J57DRAFT_1437380 [Mycena rebaudengoi]|nr:hypothetical protein C8J57DRAFT_1437380 [Mycena rebaudengoi]
MWSIAHPLRLTASNSAFVIDGRESTCLGIPLDNFFNVQDLEDPDVQVRYSIPPPSSIVVHSVPLRKYCDDTSGNVSEKWNKHNSILFTLTGLPRELIQMIYNIHFIATSNLSPPLEMMEAVVAMLREAQKDGIEVRDCEYQDWTLIIPWFLAFQGDNPMSSEFASHIGMKGIFFCRVCKAKSDKSGRAGIPRIKQQTMSDLTTQLKRAIDGAPSAVNDMVTDTGSKDKNFQQLLDKLQAAASKLRDEQKKRGSSGTGVSNAEEVKNLLHKLRAEMPNNIFNPVLSIPDFNAHRNTPVEILYVVLLGVGKEELRGRLSSVDVSGLNTPPICGNTYVQYAGSLVGRDFRVILQVALVVLHGLIPQAHYDGWVALCRLTPLTF